MNYANEEGQTISQVLHQLVDERIQLSKDMKECHSLEHIIEKDTGKTSIATAEFEQNSAMKRLLEELQDKNVQEKNKQVAEMAFGSYIDELKLQIKNLTTKFDKKLEEDNMKNMMAHFNQHSHFIK